MSRRLLTAAEVAGVCRQDPPLTAADMREVVPYLYGRDRAALALAGDPRVREPDWGSAGGYGEGDRLFVSSMADRRGIWLSITDRATGAKRGGHIPWAVAEAQLSPHVQEPLFT